MSCRRKVKSFEQIKVEIDDCNKEEIELLEKTIILALEQKLEKLNILVKNCNIFCDNGAILINDRYNTCIDLKEIALAFGLSITEINCELRGKNYIITDDLLNVLRQFNNNYEFGKNIANKEIDDIVSKIISNNCKDFKIDDSILEMVMNIKENGKYTFSKSRSVETIYYDGLVENKNVGAWSVDENKIREKLTKLSKDSQKEVNNINDCLRDGTSKLIYSRARQMGYSVQEIKKGTQVQLVLVRCD